MAEGLAEFWTPDTEPVPGAAKLDCSADRAINKLGAAVSFTPAWPPGMELRFLNAAKGENP